MKSEMPRPVRVMQIAFTYIGTVVGAGFATGQEILQFYTIYGGAAAFTIALATALFIWLGTKLLLIANDIDARSYEDFNKHLFGEKMGEWISMVSMVILLGVSTVMLAGAGSVFKEHLHMPYQTGLFVTLIFAYIVLSRGMNAVMAVNSIVVPIMLAFTFVIVIHTMSLPSSDYWIDLPSEAPASKVWTAPLLYAAFNLSMAQAVLVPLGSSIRDRTALVWGGAVGGLGIGLMLLAGHFALSARMPDITRYDIPMGQMAQNLGAAVQLIYILVIFAEIFTTFIGDLYGLMLQIQQRSTLQPQIILLCLLVLCYLVGQIGFSTLLSVLYPLFGLVSLACFILIIWRKRAA
jgi:uncharacterized membrane protein YkvI